MEQGRIRAWLSGRQKIAVSVLFLSLLSNAVVFALSLDPRGVGATPYLTELRFFLAASAACSAAEFCFDSYWVFLPVHTVRLACIFVVSRLLAGREAGAETLLLVPFLVESPLYMGLRPGLAADGLISLLLIAGDLFALRGLPLLGVLAHLAPLTILALSSSAFFALLVLYRERTVVDGKRLEAMSAAMANLSDANKAFQLYADGAESKSAMRERRRITRELHDSVGYALTNVIMSMNAGKVLLREDPARAEQVLEGARRQSEAALEETRRILRELRAIQDAPAEGLRALAHLTRIFQFSTGVKVSLNYGNVPFSFGQNIDAAIYRLVQEGLTNAFRHGKATQIRVNLWQAETEIRTTIWNNGQPAASLAEGIGISGMKERFHELGGSVAPRNVVDGFELSAAIPYRNYLIDG